MPFMSRSVHSMSCTRRLMRRTTYAMAGSTCPIRPKECSIGCFECVERRFTTREQCSEVVKRC